MPARHFSVAALFAVAAAQIHLPPLVPSIPGVTVPLASDAPPLPIAQAPTPALPSPPHTVSNIRPKKIAFIWTAAGDNQHSDFLASYSLDDDTFGTLLRIVDINSSGNSPHHSVVSADGKTLWGSGLLSLLKTQDTGYYFNVSDPYNPKFWKSDRSLLASIADEGIAKPDGGFYFTYMGSALGTSPGRLIETDRNYNIIHQYPEDTAGLLEALDTQFDPHGLSADYVRGNILTSDFVEPITVLKPSTSIRRASTVRLWDLKTHTITNSFTIPNGGGIQDVKHIPGHPEGAALATAVGPGQVWIIYPNRMGSNGKKGTIEKYIDLGPKAAMTTAIFSYITKDGKYAYFTTTTSNHVAQYDISNVDKPKRLDNPDVVQPIVGVHYIKVTPDQKNVATTGYFVQTGDIGILNTPADFKFHYPDRLPNGALKFNRYIDFSQEFPERGGAKPHSFVLLDLTNPRKPVWV